MSRWDVRIHDESFSDVSDHLSKSLCSLPHICHLLIGEVVAGDRSPCLDRERSPATNGKIKLHEQDEFGVKVERGDHGRTLHSEQKRTSARKTPRVKMIQEDAAKMSKVRS